MRPGSQTRQTALGAAAAPSASAPPQGGGGQQRARSQSDFGALFRDLRRCLRLSLPDLARRLGTHIDVIEALESGEVGRLPPWPETVRVVAAFTKLGEIDPRPVLQVINAQLAIADNSRGKSAAGARRNSIHDALCGLRKTVGDALAPLRRRSQSALAAIHFLIPDIALRPIEAARGSKRPARLALACAILTALSMSLVHSPMLQASATGGALGRVIGDIHDFVLLKTSPKRDGMVWIEVTDPKSRRTDKLRGTHR